MPREVDPRRERQYQELKSKFKREGRYRGREEEMAARTVTKQPSLRRRPVARAEVPISNYERLTVDQVKRRLGRLSETEVKRVKRYELSHKKRKTLLAEIERFLTH